MFLSHGKDFCFWSLLLKNKSSLRSIDDNDSYYIEGISFPT